MWAKRRTIKENARYTAEQNSINPNVARMDEILDGVFWQLSRDPSKDPICKRVGTSNVWAISTLEFPNAHAVIIYYTFDENEVELLSIELSDED